MKLSPILVLVLAIFGTTLFSMDTLPDVGGGNSKIIPPEKIVRLVFLGKTGAGKSTTINAFFNYAKGTEWHAYPKLFPIKTPYQECNVANYQNRKAEDHTNGQLDAVTQEPSEYVASGDDHVVNLIDCPGVADPRGVEKDEEITRDIAKFLQRAGDFNAICIVIPNTAIRATTEEKYLIEAIKSIIPKSSIDRIFLVVTHSSIASANVKKFASSLGLPTNNVFAFDHFALTEEGHMDLTGEDELADDVQSKWQASQKTFARLIATAQKLGKYSSSEMGDISEIKQQTAEKIYEAMRKLDAVRTTEKQVLEARNLVEIASSAHGFAQSSVDDAKVSRQQAEADKKAADALNAYDYYEERELVKTSYYNTFCLRCANVCHENCGLEYKGRDCVDHLSGCWCISDGRCSQCDDKCSFEAHRHRFEAWETVSRSREKSDVRAKQAHTATEYQSMVNHVADKTVILNEKANELNQQSAVLNRLNDCLANLSKEVIDLQHQIVNLYIKLDGVSMASINFHIGEYFDNRIKNTSDLAIKATLERDRQFYVEQVALYKARIASK